jgi:hypothetical protein
LNSKTLANWSFGKRFLRPNGRRYSSTPPFVPICPVHNFQRRTGYPAFGQSCLIFTRRSCIQRGTGHFIRARP